MSNKTDSKSLLFAILQYPLLAVIFIICMLDFVAYSVTRLLVYLWESLIYWGDKEKPKTYQEFVEFAKKKDTKYNLTGWKDLETNLFDEHLIVKTIRELKTRNIQQLKQVLIHKCKNDFGGIENEKLYSQLHYGTKECVDDYVDSMVYAMDRIGSSNLTTTEKFQFFKQIGHTYGRTALCLSGGATLTWFHLGVLKALHEQKLLPQILTGASAGSLMAAMVCVRTDEELDECFTPELVKHIRCCSSTWAHRYETFKRTGALLDADFFREEARWFSKDMTFLEAYQRTGRILNISVMSTEVHSKFKVLNYINTPDVTIASAVVASSSVPGVLPPCELFVKKRLAITSSPYRTRSRTSSNSSKTTSPTRSISPTGSPVKQDFTDSKLQWTEQVYDHAGQTWRDGSMKSDIPHQELYQLFRVKHTVVSQVNPHISYFFYNPLGSAGQPSRHRQGRGWRGGFILSFFVQYFLLDLLKWIQLLRNMYLLPDILGADFSHLWLQSFEGHCTITPSKPPTPQQLARLLVDPDYDRLERFIEEGEQCTWPKLKMIRNRILMEQRIGYWLRTLKEGLAKAA